MGGRAVVGRGSSPDHRGAGRRAGRPRRTRCGQPRLVAARQSPSAQAGVADPNPEYLAGLHRRLADRPRPWANRRRPPTLPTQLTGSSPVGDRATKRARSCLAVTAPAPVLVRTVLGGPPPPKQEPGGLAAAGSGDSNSTEASLFTVPQHSLTQRVLLWYPSCGWSSVYREGWT